MAKLKSSVNQKYLIIFIAILLATIGYYSYQSLLSKPDINKVTTGDDGGVYNKTIKKTKIESVPNKPKP